MCPRWKWFKFQACLNVHQSSQCRHLNRRPMWLLEGSALNCLNKEEHFFFSLSLPALLAHIFSSCWISIFFIPYSLNLLVLKSPFLFKLAPSKVHLIVNWPLQGRRYLRSPWTYRLAAYSSVIIRRAALEILTCNCLKWQPVHFAIIDRLLAVMTISAPLALYFSALYGDVLPDPTINHHSHPLPTTSLSDIKLWRLKGWHWKETVSFCHEQYEADHDNLSVN